MTFLGLPDLRFVQTNVSYNAARGTTRGIHAEPWDKLVTVAVGAAFCAWMDLRPGEGFGRVFTCEIDLTRAVFTPRGVGNSYQALEDGTTYSYLVNAHWSADLRGTYTYVNLADPELAVPWPIPLEECELSEADKGHPMLADVTPMAPKRTLVTGANGQLGRAVRAEAERRGLGGFDYTDIAEFDFSDEGAYGSIDWGLYGIVINCGAYTAVDAAETPEGRVECWKANATGPALLARACAEHDIVLVHVSSDYVFDGSHGSHAEDEPFSPLSVYGQSKAAGDVAVAGCPRHYILRSSWVIGDGRNFVRTMTALSARCADPDDPLERVTVVDDQLGRLTFADDMARAVFHLLDMHAPYGTYNLTGAGRVASWYEVARRVFELANGNADAVVPVSTEEYFTSAKGPVAPRPHRSDLCLDKIASMGFLPRDWDESLEGYVGIRS